MDYTISNNKKLFDEILRILSRHAGEPGVEEALHALNAAKENYLQRSIDHMLSNIALSLADLLRNPVHQATADELKDVFLRFVQEMLNAPARLRKLAEEYERNGGKPLSRDEILREVEERRGVHR